MDILDRFIATAKQNVREEYYRTDKELAGKKLSLRQIIDSLDFTLIAEIKHASPAGEYYFDNIDVEKTAHAFRQSGADAISVVVEPKIFKGNLANVPLAKKSGLPVLFKDFVICEEQIKAAKILGADAILLIVKVADRLSLDLHALIETAHKNDLEVLLETYDEKEMKTAMGSEADILGINNRDLETLDVDIKRTENIMEKFGQKLDRPLISESGIKSAKDVSFVKKAGARGALVGTAIWTSENIGEKISELKRAGGHYARE